MEKSVNFSGRAVISTFTCRETTSSSMFPAGERVSS